jgi:hypothetical protein
MMTRDPRTTAAMDTGSSGTTPWTFSVALAQTSTKRGSIWTSVCLPVSRTSKQSWKTSSGLSSTKSAVYPPFVQDAGTTAELFPLDSSEDPPEPEEPDDESDEEPLEELDDEDELEELDEEDEDEELDDELDDEDELEELDDG